MSSQASSAGRGEAEVRQKMVETGALDVMIDIRGNFFYTRTIPCQLWFFDRAKERDKARRDHVLMLDARNIYRKVTRAIFDFSPEQQKNIAAIIWLYRGQPERFLRLVESYLAQAVSEGQATAQPLSVFVEAVGKQIDLMEPFANEARGPDPLADMWRNSPLRRLRCQPTSRRSWTRSMRRLENGIRRGTASLGTMLRCTRRGKACTSWRNAART